MNLNDTEKLEGIGGVWAKIRMNLNDTEKLEGIGDVSEKEIKNIELQNHEKDEFIGLEADIEEDSLWDTK
ncbi:hypothetical protein A6M57_13475 [Staphylococcus pseudintermedius]|nr:hypothetical protein [Staphylococcus pseudintermedius]ANS91011.1 hypothetical protein A6M57_13475 [Staphylococcus pseudintermedius]